MAYALQLLAEPDHTMTSIAKMLGVSRILYNALPGLVPVQRDERADLEARLALLPKDSRPGSPSVEQYDQLLTQGQPMNRTTGQTARS